MEKQLEIFNELYLVTKEWIKEQPWLKLWSND